MRLISPGKIEIALDGREISSVILISKFRQQHHPQRAQENPDLRISGTSDEEFVWTWRSICLRREVIFMFKHNGGWDIKVLMKLKSGIVCNNMSASEFMFHSDITGIYKKDVH
jgi:hypothetical protein